MFSIFYEAKPFSHGGPSQFADLVVDQLVAQRTVQVVAQENDSGIAQELKNGVNQGGQLCLVGRRHGHFLKRIGDQERKTGEQGGIPGQYGVVMRRRLGFGHEDVSVRNAGGSKVDQMPWGEVGNSCKSDQARFNRGHRDEGQKLCRHPAVPRTIRNYASGIYP